MAAMIGKVTRADSGFLYGDVREAAEAIAAYDMGVDFQYDIKRRFNEDRSTAGFVVVVRDRDDYAKGYLGQVAA